jgi:hypothetical protein
MVRNTKPLSGGGKDKFLRGLVDAVADVPPGVRLALSAELTQAISEVRVRRQAYDRVRDQPDSPGAPAKVASTRAVPPKAEALPPAATPPAFDPFAFSVVAVLTKKGKAALLVELDKVLAVEDLRRIADAQHLALDPELSFASHIRAAIVIGAERRIAERKAAAS